MMFSTLIGLNLSLLMMLLDLLPSTFFLLNQAAFAYQTTAPTCFQQRAHHPCTYIIHILIKLRSPEFLFFRSPRISEHREEPGTQSNEAGFRQFHSLGR